MVPVSASNTRPLVTFTRATGSPIGTVVDIFPPPTEVITSIDCPHVTPTAARRKAASPLSGPGHSALFSAASPGGAVRFTHVGAVGAQGRWAGPLHVPTAVCRAEPGRP